MVENSLNLCSCNILQRMQQQVATYQDYLRIQQGNCGRSVNIITLLKLIYIRYIYILLVTVISFTRPRNRYTRRSILPRRQYIKNHSKDARAHLADYYIDIRISIFREEELCYANIIKLSDRISLDTSSQFRIFNTHVS